MDKHLLITVSEQQSALYGVRFAGNLFSDKEGIFLNARDSLVNNGLPSEMIKTKVVEDANVARAILSEADEGRFSAVAVGRTGAGQGILGKIFMGSVSTKLFRELEGAALWLCY